MLKAFFIRKTLKTLEVYFFWKPIADIVALNWKVSMNEHFSILCTHTVHCTLTKLSLVFEELTFKEMYWIFSTAR